MTKAIQLLDDEHTKIKSVLTQCSSLYEFSLVNDFVAFDHKVNELLSFFRNYADRFHHKKEEDILFPEIAKRNELVGEGVITEMLENHADMRDMLRKIEANLNKGDVKVVCDLFITYEQMLLDHIAVEDDEVFQVAETLLNDNELETIYFKFLDADNEIGIEEKNRLSKAFN